MNRGDIYREERGSDKNAQKKSIHRATEMELLYQRAQGGDKQAAKELQRLMDEDAERFRKEHEGQWQKEEEGRKRQKEAAEKRYPPEEVTINGITMRIYWDDDHNRYTMHFPQIEIGERGAGKRGDQIIIISDDPETARKVFEGAKRIAQKKGDVYKVYDAIDAVAMKLSETK